jgi:transposase-like protein
MRERQRAVQLYRGQIPSPGRPTVAWRQDRVGFGAAIARGASSEDAARGIGVSPAVGSRWFRNAGDMAPNLPPAVSGRYLSYAEREDIAIWHAQKAGVREIARRLGRSPSTVSRELRRNREYIASAPEPTLDGVRHVPFCVNSMSAKVAPPW